MPFKRLRKPSRSRCESAGVFNERNVLQNVEVIQSVDVGNAHGGNKEVNLRRDGLNGHHFITLGDFTPTRTVAAYCRKVQFRHFLSEPLRQEVE